MIFPDGPWQATFGTGGDCLTFEATAIYYDGTKAKQARERAAKKERLEADSPGSLLCGSRKQQRKFFRRLRKRAQKDATAGG